MAAIVSNIRWVMILSGVLTFTMIHAAFAPQAALSSMFGETLQGPLAEIIVRNWGVLIAIVGGLLIYERSIHRRAHSCSLSLRSARRSSSAWCCLTVVVLGHQAGIAVTVDSVRCCCSRGSGGRANRSYDPSP